MPLGQSGRDSVQKYSQAIPVTAWPHSYHLVINLLIAVIYLRTNNIFYVVISSILIMVNLLLLFVMLGSKTGDIQ